MNNINLACGINSTSYGLVGSNLLKYFDLARYDISLFNLGGQIEVLSELGPLVDKSLANAESFDYQAPSFRCWHQFDLANCPSRGLKIGYSFFEGTKFTKTELSHINSLDIFCVPSVWAEKVCVENGIKCDIKVLHPGVDHEIFNKDVEPANIDKSGENTTVFLHVGKWEVRKNGQQLLDIFNAAFEPSDDVLLVVHAHNPLMFPGFDGEKYSREWSFHYMNSKMGRAGKIKIVGGRLPNQDSLAELMQAADCGIFPSKAEGWNLPLAEMMAMGKNVIATNYSAHPDFCKPNRVDLIDIEEFEDCYDGVFFHGNVGQWASFGQNQIEQAANHMREIHKQKQNGELKPREVVLFPWEQTIRNIECLL